VAAGICLREIPVAARILTGVLAAWWVRFLPPSRRFLVGVLGSPTFSFPARQPRRLSTSLLQLGKSKGKGKQSHYSLAFLCLGELFPRAEQSRASLLLFFASAHPPTTHYNSPQPNPTSPIDLTGLARSAVASVSLSLGTIGSDWSSSIVIPSGCPSPSDHPPHSFIAFQL